ncbi:ATP-binding protein [Flavobacterium sp.]|uniref:ATP-binding protein n=1 Tax=Flavobacterium sp. TaxID=239 RepID=UPI00260840C1|nr:ATP-binding protein [Flavobacterium sp.]
MQEINTDWLSQQAAFSGVPPAQLEWFINKSSHYILNTGEELFSAGKPIEGIQVITSGKVTIFAKDGTSTSATLEAGDVTGTLPFSRMAAPTGSAVTSVTTQVMFFPSAYIREMVKDHFELTEALVHQMLSRVRNFTSLQQQNEKMIALGKLSAGLAHELNNPAAAIVRDALSLKSHLSILPESFKAVMNIRMSPEEVDIVNNILFTSLDKERPVLSLMEKMQLEEELDEWMASHGIAGNTELIETFTEFGFSATDLDNFAKYIPETSLSAVLKWISDNIITDKIVGGIGNAAQRIESLINSVKSYTHMDRGRDKEAIDIHSGIRNSVVMLGYKLRNNNVSLQENYDKQLPYIKVMVGEMNQVWTNLIDNALDAMENLPKGILNIATVRDGDYAKITITDNGPGIPSEIIPMIFDPFFTTKAIGKGTGLGLEVVRRIVQQHSGTITVDSRPGCTSFTVCLPILS